MADNTLAEGARQFAIKMNLGAYKEAAKIKSDFGLPNEMLLDAVKNAYNVNMKKGDYSLAAELAKQYDLPSDLRLDAAQRSFHRKVDSEASSGRQPIMPRNSACPRIWSEKQLCRPSTRA